MLFRSSPRFVALWVALTDASNNRRVLVDLTEDELRQEDSELGKSMGVVKLSVSINNSEERRYCAIYSEEAPVYEFYWRRQAGDYLDRPQTDLSISKPRSRNFDLIASLKKKTKDYETLDDLQKQDFVKQTGNANDLARAYFLLSDFERSLAVCRAGLEVFPVDDALHLTELLSLVAASRSNDAI